MKKIAVILLVAAFLMSFASRSYAWPWDKKTEAKQSAPKIAAPAAATEAKTSKFETPKMPVIVIPKIPQPVIPKISIVMPGEERDIKNTTAFGSAAIGTAQKEQPQVRQFKSGMVIGEIVSVDTKDPEKVSVKVKSEGEGNEEIDVIASSRISVTKRMKAADLKQGEKVMLHYLINDTTKIKEATYISAGEMPRMPMPMQIKKERAQ